MYLGLLISRRLLGGVPPLQAALGGTLLHVQSDAQAQRMRAVKGDARHGIRRMPVGFPVGARLSVPRHNAQAVATINVLAGRHDGLLSYHPPTHCQRFLDTTPSTSHAYAAGISQRRA